MRSALRFAFAGRALHGSLWLALAGCGGTSAVDAGAPDAHRGDASPVDAGTDAGAVPDDAADLDATLPIDAVTLDTLPDAAPLCASPQRELCNAFDDDCDGQIDDSACTDSRAQCEVRTGPLGRLYLFCRGRGGFGFSGYEATTDLCATLGRPYRSVDLDTVEERVFLDAIVDGSYWVGLRRFAPDDALTDASGTTRDAADFTFDPDDSRLEDERCFIATTRGLVQASCDTSELRDEPVGFLCEAAAATSAPTLGPAETCNWLDDDLDGRVDETPCSQGVVREYHGARYLFGYDEMPWNEARTLCSSLGAHLAYVDDRYEDRVLTVLRELATSRALWIGASDDPARVDGAVERQFRWLDGRVVADGYSAIAADQNGGPGDTGMPDMEDCLTISFSPNGGWHDRNCEILQSYVCEYALP